MSIFAECVVRDAPRFPLVLRTMALRDGIEKRQKHSDLKNYSPWEMSEE